MTVRPVRRTTAWLLGLAAVVYLAGVGLHQAALTVDPNEAKAESLPAIEDRSYDVLYLGNSVPYQGINPAVIDEICHTDGYNMALGGSTAIEQELLLRGYLAKNARPKLVVYGVTPNLGEFGNKVRPTVYLALDEGQREVLRSFLETVNEDPPGVADEVLFRLAAYRYRSAFEPLLKYLYRGESRRPSYVKGHLTYNETGAVPERFPPQQAGVDVAGMRSLLDFCQSEKLRVMLVELPHSPSFNAAVRGRDAALAAVVALVRERANVQFLSLNDQRVAEQFGPSDWLGVNHFNTAGAEKFSRLLAPHIERMLGSPVGQPIARQDRAP